MAGYCALFEGYGGTQNIVQTFWDEPGQDFRVKVNDEACSAIFYNVRVGTRLELYDDPSGNTRKSHTFVEFTKQVAEYVLRDFDHSYTDDVVTVISVRDGKGRVSGKLTRVRVRAVE